MASEKKDIRNKLSRLAQYKDSPEKLEHAVEEKYNKEVFEQEWNCDLEIEEEKTYYYNIVRKYLAFGEIENSSDKELLKQLCYLEVVNYRIRRALNEYSKNNVNAPYKDLDNLNKNIEQIIVIKKQLGLTSESDSSANEFVQVMESLKSRFNKWINKPEHKANYTCRCPYCKELILIRRRIDKDLDSTIPHPWFVKGGLLFNEHVFKLLQENKITEDDVCKILYCDKDYIPWLMKNYRVELFQKDKTEEA